MAGKDGELRRRAVKQKAKDKENARKQDKPTTEEPEAEEPVLQTISSHWLIRYVLPTYIIFLGFKFMNQYSKNIKIKPVQHWILQDPEWINDMFPFANLRESVGHTDERQLLVVGTMSSGTRQVSASLEDTLALEMGHELSDSQSFFVRDGTVSWFFGIRFFDPPPSPGKIATFCSEAIYELGFHPRMYRGGICSEKDQWSHCWAKECVDILQTEWGCALQNKCQFQPFQRTLHQTRNPLAVVESLVAKFCNKEEDKGSSVQDHEALVKISSLLFGNHHNFDQYSCLEVASHHVMEYNKAMVAAREKGVIHAMYKVEDTTPCEVAKLAGFAGIANEDTVIYPPNMIKFQSKCDPLQSSKSSPGHQLMTPRNIYKVNKGQVKLDWTDLEGGKHGSNRPSDDMSLVDEMKQMMQSLGYDPDDVPKKIEEQVGGGDAE